MEAKGGRKFCCLPGLSICQDDAKVNLCNFDVLCLLYVDATASSVINAVQITVVTQFLVAATASRLRAAGADFRCIAATANCQCICCGTKGKGCDGDGNGEANVSFHDFSSV